MSSSVDLANMNVRMETLPAEGNKNIYAQFSVFRKPNMREARLTLAVFDRERRGKPIFEAVFSPRWVGESIGVWNDLINTPEPDKKEVYPVFKGVFADGKRKSENIGQLVYGIDKGGAPYIGVIVGKDAFKFPLRRDPNYGTPDDYAPRLLVAAGGNFLIEIMRGGMDLVNQSRLVPAVDDGRGGNGGGGGYNRGGGGGYSRGGNGGGGGVSEDDIAF